MRFQEIDFQKYEPLIVVISVLVICFWIILNTDECDSQCLRRVEH